MVDNLLVVLHCKGGIELRVTLESLRKWNSEKSEAVGVVPIELEKREHGNILNSTFCLREILHTPLLLSVRLTFRSQIIYDT